MKTAPKFDVFEPYLRIQIRNQPLHFVSFGASCDESMDTLKCICCNGFMDLRGDDSSRDGHCQDSEMQQRHTACAYLGLDTLRSASFANIVKSRLAAPSLAGFDNVRFPGFSLFFVFFFEPDYPMSPETQIILLSISTLSCLQNSWFFNHNSGCRFRVCTPFMDSRTPWPRRCSQLHLRLRWLWNQSGCFYVSINGGSCQFFRWNQAMKPWIAFDSWPDSSPAENFWLDSDRRDS
jgi:hypothetical protein